MSHSKSLKNFKRYSNTNLNAFGRNVLLNLTGNADFPSPDVPLSTIQTACDDFDLLIQHAIKGSKYDYDAMKAQRLVVIDLLDKEADYVSRIAQGDITLIEGAGFMASKTGKSKRSEPDRVLIKSIKSLHRGMVELELFPLKNCSGFVAMAAPDGNLKNMVFNPSCVIMKPSTANDVVVAFTTNHKLLMTGLKSITQYEVLVFGFNPNGKGAESNIVSVVVQ